MNQSIHSTATGASHALPANQPGSMSLFQLHDLLRLCAFAAEARRTLQGYADWETYCDIPPDVKKSLNAAIYAPREWAQHPDNLAGVLGFLADHVEMLAEQDANQASKGGAA